MVTAIFRISYDLLVGDSFVLTDHFEHKKSDHMRLSKSICQNDGGAMIAPLAIMMPILFGMAGLGIDIGSWYNGKRQAQAAADAAARAGALELVRKGSDSMILDAALDDAVAYGFDASKVHINMPPLSGSYTGDDTAVEAVVEYHPDSFFSNAILDVDVKVEARAVARVIQRDTCVWALEENDPGFEIVGTADVELDCRIQVNSGHETALDQVGSSCVTASSILVVGGASGNCLTPLPATGSAPSDDPLAYVDPPSDADAGCTYANKVKVNKSTTLSPGVYCDGISISGNADVTFDDGIYILKGGTLKVAGSASLEGDEVAFYLTDNAELDITATTIDFSAPESGDLEGILFFQDRDDLSTVTNKIAGNAGLELEGALYFPTTELHFRGTSSTAVPSPIIVARKLRFVGTTSLGGNGEPPPITMAEATLVE